MEYILAMSVSIVEDDQVVDAIILKKDLFTSRFVKENDPRYWTGEDHMYFKHVCTVLDHAKHIFRADLESMVDKKVKLQDA
jgi:hypothetical protein